MRGVVPVRRAEPKLAARAKAGEADLPDTGADTRPSEAREMEAAGVEPLKVRFFNLLVAHAFGNKGSILKHLRTVSESPWVLSKPLKSSYVVEDCVEEEPPFPRPVGAGAGPASSTMPETHISRPQKIGSAVLHLG